MNNIFRFICESKINFNAEQGGGMDQNAAALFAQKANEDGSEGGKHGILSMNQSLEKILLPLGAINQAAKTFEGLEKSSIQGALSPITNPLPGVIQIGTTHLNILGVNILGEKKHLNMSASSQEIVGEIQSLIGENDSSGSGDNGENYQSQHGDMFDENHQDYSSVEDAGHKIFNSSDHDSSYDFANSRGVENYSDSENHHYTPDPSPQQISSGGKSFDHD
jgi:hypothetical protein